MLNPVHLQTLTAVIRAGSFADAARQLGYTSSAVSQQVAALERAVKMPLFERGASSIRPTPAAEFLMHRARDVLAALDALEEQVRDMRDGRIGRLRLGSFATASERLLPIALTPYVRTNPGIEISLQEGEPDELVPLLLDGQLDLALVYSYDLVPRVWSASLNARRLLDEDLVLLLPVRHALAAADLIGLDDLKQETWVATKEGTAGAACLRRLCADAAFQPRVCYRSNDYDVIASFVRSGLGIALMPALGHVPGDGITALCLDGVTVCRRVTLLSRTGDGNPAVTGAADALGQAASRLAEKLPWVACPGRA